MTARIVTDTGLPIDPAYLEFEADRVRKLLAVPSRFAATRRASLWERATVQPMPMPRSFFEGGEPVTDDDLYRKQQAEQEIADY